MNKEKGFKLNDQQKIEFGELAINQLTQDNPQFPANLAVDEIGATNIIFSNYSQSVSAESTLVFLFDYCGMDVFCYLNGQPNGDYSDTVRPLYLDYMCKTFGEPYREAAIHYWQECAAAERLAFAAHQAQAIAKLTAKLNHEETQMLSKQTYILGSLMGQEPTKLKNSALPKMPLRDATAAAAPDREK